MGLVLGRKAGEGVVITDTDTGERLGFQVVDVDRKNVRIAFNAPMKYNIVRSELVNHDSQCCGDAGCLCK